MISKFISKLIKFFFYLVFVAFAVFLILVGFQYNKMSKKHYVFDKTIDSIRDKSYSFIKIEDPYNFGDDFRVTSNIDIDLSSEDYENKSKYNSDYLKKNNVLTNLSNMTIQTNIAQSKEDGQFLASLEEKIGDENIISGKYYIDNYTKYYYVKDILSQYVNSGNNNYFELLNNKNTTQDNIDYIYNKIFNSLKKNIKEEDLNAYDTEINLGDGRKQVGQVSLKITNDYYKKLLKNTLKDIKKDKKASQIIEGLYPKFSEFEFDENKEYLDKNESYTINIYVRKVLFQPLKYEIVHLKDETQEIFTYEGSLESGVLYYSKNNEVKYTGECESTPKKIEIIMHDTTGRDIGIIKLEKTTNSISYNTSLDLENNNYLMSYETIYKNFEKNKSYVKEDTISFKITNNTVTKINGTIKVESTVNKDPKIKEDIDSSILESTVDESVRERIDNLYDSVKERLER